MDFLPSELIAHIFQYLPATDIAKCEHLNRRCGSIIQRNRSSFKNPNIRVLYSENAMKEMVIRVISGDIGSPWDSGRLLRKITVQDCGRILLVQGGDGEFPEGGDDEIETMTIVLGWIKENIKVVYARCGQNEVPDIPELVINGCSSESRLRPVFLWNVLRKDRFTIGVLRMVDTTSVFQQFIMNHRSLIERLHIEARNRVDCDGIIKLAQNIEDVTIYTETNRVIKILNILKRGWREMKEDPEWSAKLLFKKENQEDESLAKILDHIHSSQDEDFQLSLTLEDQNCMQTVIIRGSTVPGPDESPELPRRRIWGNALFPWGRNPNNGLPF